MMSEADELNQVDMPIEAARSAALLYGRCNRIARQFGISQEVRNTTSRLYQLISRVVVPNRDEARMVAYEGLRAVGEEYLESGKRSEAAVELTNAALQVVEMNNPEPEALRAARDLLRRTRSMRKRNSIDFAYSELNLAIAERLVLSSEPEEATSEQYGNIVAALDRAMRVAKKLGHKRQFLPYWHSNVLETLVDWLGFEAEAVERDLILSQLPPDFEVPRMFLMLDRVEVARAARKNPRIFGMDEVPDWIPSESVVRRLALRKVPTLVRRIEDARGYLESHSQDIQVAQRLFELESSAYVDEPPTFPFSELQTVWNQGNYEVFLMRAFAFLGWDRARESSPNDLVAILDKIESAIRAIRGDWSDRDVIRFFRRNPVAIRFAAVDLANLDKWEAAFNLLEISRSVESSGAIGGLIPLQEGSSPESVWAHVTHSPAGIAVIVLDSGKYYGRFYGEFDGSLLTSKFSGHEPMGLLTAQLMREREAAATAAGEIESLLSPIGDYLGECVDDGRALVLCLGGFFQAFPVWALGTLRDARSVRIAPSKSVADSLASREANLSSHASVLVAAEVPGEAPLKISRLDGDVISGLIGDRVEVVVDNEVTRDSFLRKVRESQKFLHFSGHSNAEIDPMYSGLATNDEPVLVSDILHVNVGAELVVLSSCQSGLAHNVMLQDEVLSIQSSFYYSGARAVVGTCWPILDVASYVFSYYFYPALGELGKFDSESAAVAAKVAVDRMRLATRSDVGGLLEALGFDVELAGDSPFFSFYDWAAFSVLGY